MIVAMHQEGAWLVTVTFESQGCGRRKLLHIFSSPRSIPWGAFIRVEQPSSRSILLENLAGPTIIVNAAIETYLDTKGE